ncbi:MAG: hypothetical protein HUU50_14850 [Candidatus Brocadiae bacterium]|nr:hypothetical protein [Candidatus Brocadiia bacterium]
MIPYRRLTFRLLLEMKFGSKALHLLKKIGKIEDSEELTLLKQTIRMSKDIKEIEEYLEDIARS